MKKSLLCMVACAALLASCQNDTMNSIMMDEPTFSGGVDKNETRVYMGEDYFYRWEQGDEVSIFTLDNRNRKYKAKTGNVILTDFEFVSKPGISGISLDKQTSNYAIFPYAESNAASFVTGAYYTLSATLSSEQTYEKDNLNHAIMVSKIPASSKIFEFRNSCSLIKINVNTTEEFADEATINSIKVESKNHKLAGKVTIEVEKDDYTARIYEQGGECTNSVLLTECNDAGILGTDYQTFYLVIPAGTYESGDLTITIDTDKDALDYTATLSSEYTVARSEYIELKTTLNPSFQGTFDWFKEDANSVSIASDAILEDQTFMCTDAIINLGYPAHENALELPDGDYTIEGNNHTLTFKATEGDKMAINVFSTQASGIDGTTPGKVTINNLTLAGELQTTMLGIYVPKYANQDDFNTELNNVNIIDTKSCSLSANMGAALCIYGKAVLNNCNVYGTTRTALENSPMWPLYDVAAMNYSETTINGGKIGSFLFWNQAALTIENNAVIERLVILGNMNTTNEKNYIHIKSGTEVSIIDLSKITDKNRVKITIDNGATVEKIIGNNGEYNSLDEWKNGE